MPSAFYRQIYRLLKNSALALLFVFCWLPSHPAGAQGRPNVLWMKGGFAYNVTCSPDGQILATDGTKLWRASDGALFRTLQSDMEVNRATFLSDSQTVVGWSGTGVVFWRASDGAVLQTFLCIPVERSPFGPLALSTDEQTLFNSGNGAESRYITRRRLSDGAALWTTYLDIGPPSGVVSPNGQLLAVAADDNTGNSAVFLLRVSDGTVLRTFNLPGVGYTGSLSFSPDSQILALAETGNVRLWHVSDGTSLPTLPHPASVASLAFSPDGSTLATGTGGSDYLVRLWRVSDGTVLRSLTGHIFDVRGVAFSPDGQTLFSTSGKQFLRWRVSDGTLLQTLTNHTGRISGVAFTPDGQTVASSAWVNDRIIRFWRASDGVPLDTLDNTAEVASMALSPNGQMLVTGAGNGDTKVRLWRLSDKTLLRTMTGHTGPVYTVAFSPDGQTIASCSSDQTIKLWRASDGFLLRTLTGHTGFVHSIAFSPDGQTLASGSMDQTIKIWNPAIGFVLRTLTGHTDRVLSVAYSPDGQTLVSGSSDTTAKLWRVSDGALLRTLSGHTDRVLSVAFTPDGQRIASGGYDNTLRFWRVSDGTLLKTYDQEAATLSRIAFSPDNRRLVYGRDDSTVVFAKNPFGPVATVSGTITLENIVPNAASQPLDLVFRPTDNSDDILKTASVGPNGVFSVSDILRETYTLHIKGAKYLAANVAVNATNGNVSGVTAFLKAGDANDDNAVDVLDLDALIQAFDSTEGDANWNNGAADFDCDGSVDVLDLDLLIRNFDQFGDP